MRCRAAYETKSTISDESVRTCRKDRGSLARSFGDANFIECSATFSRVVFETSEFYSMFKAKTYNYDVSNFIT